jgi:hypothetical protein
MKTTEKVVNYTPEQTAQVIQLYAEGVNLDQIAETVNKTKYSVIAKLVKEGVYKVTAPATKRMKKADMLRAVEKHMQLEEGSLDTVEKASHEAITILYHAVLKS